MKKEIFLTVLLFSFFGSYAQNYVPFPETDAKWISNIYYNEPQGKKGSYCYDSHIETVGDTIIGGVRYVKLQETKVEYPAYPYVCISTYVDTITTSYFGLIRNDTINKKVYFRNWFWNRDTLLYDFDLQIGDTVPNTYLFHNRLSNPYIVDTIKQANIGGSDRRVFLYSRSTDIYSDSLIEGVGSFFGRNGMKIYPTSQSGINYTFFCMSVSGTKIFPPNGNCPVITSIGEEKLDEPEINIYPNPAKDNFSIEYPEGIIVGSIQLYDCTGRLAKKFMPGKEVYDIGNHPAGIYFVQIEIKGQFHSQKLMIE